MLLQGHIQTQYPGLINSIQAMSTAVTQMGIHSDNISHFGVPGYQRKVPITTSFVEFLGPNAVDSVVSADRGRLRNTETPTHLALNCEGYFQKLRSNGTIELTRDGRFAVDKQGYFRTLDGQFVLTDAGTPLQLPSIPVDIKKELTISPNGTVSMVTGTMGEIRAIGRVGVVNRHGRAITNIDVKQGYVEDSNVILQYEFVNMVPIRRQFEANRQLFIIQSDTLSRTIQELGRTS